MAQLITLYWRDIPAQVIAERGRGRKREQAKIELSRRFAIAIDAAIAATGAGNVMLSTIASCISSAAATATALAPPPRAEPEWRAALDAQPFAQRRRVSRAHALALDVSIGDEQRALGVSLPRLKPARERRARERELAHRRGDQQATQEVSPPPPCLRSLS